jgi:CBS domain-containing protein
MAGKIQFASAHTAGGSPRCLLSADGPGGVFERRTCGNAQTAPCRRATLQATPAGENTMQLLKELMSRDVKLVGPETSIADAARQMRDGEFGMLPVGEKDRLIGTISDRDIAIRAVAAGKDGSTAVRDVMSEGVAWAYEDDSVEQAAKLMSERQVRRLPVVDRNKRLVGIVALGDFAVDAGDMRPAAEALAEISRPA